MAESKNSFNAKKTLEVGDKSYDYFALDAVEGMEKLPYSLKVLGENLLRNASACLRPGVSPRLAALSLHALVVGLFTDWTRDTGLFAPLVDTKALIDPLFRGLVRDWPDDPDQLGA